MPCNNSGKFTTRFRLVTPNHSLGLHDNSAIFLNTFGVAHFLIKSGWDQTWQGEPAKNENGNKESAKDLCALVRMKTARNATRSNKVACFGAPERLSSPRAFCFRQISLTRTLPSPRPQLVVLRSQPLSLPDSSARRRRPRSRHFVLGVLVFFVFLVFRCLTFPSFNELFVGSLPSLTRFDSIWS